ncbi:sugar ABC transporter substrate-binding protein [Radiobacillus kanasensis]|uniref:ABC transporter substrate-binding protein n=1 Tax=Radiobacillus kanasensis TaxID=2844358 RepID=UPI001E65501D|nr:sugar ABC transporter substrate-binding protein [Radiobacillus kanasensis]UFT98687.1 sugar ABC transporter substrate-binding protein [Radiobacillus kanasensis]
MKKFVLFLIIGLLALSACSSNETADSEENEKVEISFSMWGNDDHIAMYEKLLEEEFYPSHPNIKVNIETTPFADYQQNITVLAAGKELADIGWAAERMVPQFIDNGILKDLSALKEDSDFAFEDIIPGTLSQYEADGDLYGIPFSTPPHIVFYNKELFEKHGLETPVELEKKGEWTWETFEEAAKVIAQDEGVYGANMFREWNYWQNLLPHTWSYGGGMFSEDMKEFAWNSEAGEKTFGMLERMMFEDESHPKAGDQVAFEAGNVGMFFDVYSYISTARSIEDFTWDIAPIPSGPEGKFPLMGQAGYVMFEGTEHPEEAMEVIKFFASKEGMTTTSTFFAPPRNSVLQSDEFINQEGNPSRESMELAILNPTENARVLPIHKEWNEIDKEVLLGLDQLFGQTATPSELLDGMKERIDKHLSDSE